MDPFTFTAASRLTADVVCEQVADDWISTFHDDQYHRLTFRGRAAYRAVVAEHFYEDGLLENGLRSAWESALDVLPTPQEFGRQADEQDRVESTVTR